MSRTSSGAGQGYPPKPSGLNTSPNPQHHKASSAGGRGGGRGNFPHRKGLSGQKPQGPHALCTRLPGPSQQGRACPPGACRGLWGPTCCASQGQRAAGGYPRTTSQCPLPCLGAPRPAGLSRVFHRRQPCACHELQSPHCPLQLRTGPAPGPPRGTTSAASTPLPECACHLGAQSSCGSFQGWKRPGSSPMSYDRWQWRGLGPSSLLSAPSCLHLASAGDPAASPCTC